MTIYVISLGVILRGFAALSCPVTPGIILGVRNTLMNLIHGDCIEEMAKMPGSSVDAIVTDPPYGIEFMGKNWDSFGRKKEYKAQSDQGYGDKGILPSYGRGGLNKDRVKFHKRANEEFYKFSLAWALEALRILKPGGYLLAFGGTRTYHRLACAIEDAGFEIRDQIDWQYGSGFPKSLSIPKALDKAGGASPHEQADLLRKRREAAGMSREHLASLIGCTESSVRDWEEGRARAKGAPIEHIIPSAEYREKLAQILGYSADERQIIGVSIDRRDDGTSIGLGHTGTLRTGGHTTAAKKWSGWGTALKPAHEPICLAMKPLDGTFAENVQKWNVGGINIDACRIDLNGDYKSKPNGRPSLTQLGDNYDPEKANKADTVGRWPANLVLSHLPECIKIGTKKVRGDGRDPQNGERPSGFYNVGSQKGAEKPCGPLYGDADGTETVEDWRCAEGCPIRDLDEQSGILKSGDNCVRTKTGSFMEHGGLGRAGDVQTTYGDTGGASRFFYTTKAGSDERWYWCKDCKIAGCFAEDIISPHCPKHGKNLATADFGPLFGGTETPVCSCPPSPRDVHEGHSLEAHPTVKPVDLVSWLVRLVTPPGGMVLDPFLGSGTTAIAASRQGFRWIGIEKTAEYIEISKARLEKEKKVFLRTE